MQKRLSILLLFVAALVAPAQPAAPSPFARLPLEQDGGTWPTSHVQGIAVDVQGGFIYYSFTTLLAKYDFRFLAVFSERWSGLSPSR